MGSKSSKPPPPPPPAQVSKASSSAEGAARLTDDLMRLRAAQRRTYLAGSDQQTSPGSSYLGS